MDSQAELNGDLQNQAKQKTSDKGSQQQNANNQPQSAESTSTTKPIIVTNSRVADASQADCGTSDTSASTAKVTNSATTSQANAPQTQPNQQQAQQGAFLPLTRSRHREHLDNQEILDINQIEGKATIQNAAARSRLCEFALREQEYIAVRDIIGSDSEKYEVVVHIRNLILSLWLNKVNKELTKSEAFKGFSDCFQVVDAEKEFVNEVFNRVYNFLDRNGYINFGIFEDQFSSSERSNIINDKSRKAALMTSNMYTPPLKNNKKPGRIIVIGAGLAGLTAARQLQRFGLEVIVLEARNRVGGRVVTVRKGNITQDLGPFALNGITGNPTAVLGRQLNVSVTELKQKIPLYESKIDKNGQTVAHMVDPLLERAIEREHSKIMEGTRVIKNNYKIETYKGNPFPVGMSVDWVMKLQEKNVKDEQKRHLKSIESLYKQLLDNTSRKLARAKTIKDLNSQLSSMKTIPQEEVFHKDQVLIDTFNRRSIIRDLDIAFKEYKLLTEKEDELHSKIDELSKNFPSDTYLSLNDRKILDWHFAELEYALGCPINKLGIHYEDDEAMFDGSHWMLVHGFNQITEGMKQNLNINLSTAVKKIVIKKNSCKVIAYNPDIPNPPLVEYTADAVLCTLPLGILQESIIHSHQASTETSKMEQIRTVQRGPQPLVFQPPLPKWKTQALNRIGYGNLNKIVLIFDRVFWDPSIHLIGTVNHKALHRGELFLFWHFLRAPVLTGLFSGESADYIEKLSDLEIQERTLGLLRSIYGTSNVPAPKECIVTRWRKDPWSKGAWSYLQTGAKSANYEDASKPCTLSADEKSFKDKSKMDFDRDSTVEYSHAMSTEDCPRLFFAGEHTDRNHFASAHGAILSGLREASRIANIFLGCPYDLNSGIHLG